MKNQRMVNQMVQNVKGGTKAVFNQIAVKLVRKIQHNVLGEVQTVQEVIDEREVMLSNLIMEQFNSIYETYDRKDRISPKRLEQARETLKEVASAVYDNNIVEGDSMLERGRCYCHHILERSESDTFRDRRNQCAEEVKDLIRSINDMELYYQIEDLLVMAVKNVIDTAKRQRDLDVVTEQQESLNDIAKSIVSQTMDEMKEEALFIENL